MGFNCISSLAWPIYFYFTVISTISNCRTSVLKPLAGVKKGKVFFFNKPIHH